MEQVAPKGRTSRRSILSVMAGAPLIPVVGFAMSATPGSDAKAATGGMPRAGDFIGMDPPTTPEAQAATTIGSSLEVTYDDASKQIFRLGYQPLFLTGDQVPDGKGGTTLAGGYYDVDGKPILDSSVSPAVPIYSDSPDGFSLLALPGARVPGVTGNPVFAVVQFEYTTRNARDEDMYHRLPAQIAVLTLDQDKETGALKLVKYAPVDASGVHGLWTTCGASLSPWNTHLSSEEYEPDATLAASDDVFKAYSRSFFHDPAKANPYHYGHLPEVIVNPDGTGTLKKHYTLGRISHELVQVMPDRRTVLMGDDATNSGLFMFIADNPADLSAGTLYAARLAQQPGVAIDKGGVFDIRWVRLGHATSEEIRMLADTMKVSDIVDVKTKDPKDPGYTEIGFGGKRQWVKFKPGMEKAAAFLETHRWAPTVGGTLAFTKLEGVTVNAKDKVAYMAMSYIYKSMSDGKSGIKVDAINAGAVYQLPMADGQTDTSGKTIDSAWVPTRMSTVPALVGRDLKQPDDLGNTADVNRVSNPDNLKFSERLRVLFVGEDSSGHTNNFLWAYNVDSGKLARVLSCPAAAESTGLQAVDDLNGFMYVMSNFQHPGDWAGAPAGDLEDSLRNERRAAVGRLIDANYRNRRAAAVGYIHGLPPVG